MRLSNTILGIILLFTISLSHTAYAQKRALEHEDFDKWKNIRSTDLSKDGKYMIYHLVPGKGDQTLIAKTFEGKEIARVDRAENGVITHDDQYAVFTIKPSMDSVNNLRRKKTKPNDMPKDSLGILNLVSGEMIKIPRVQKFKVPEKWGDYTLYLLDEPEPDTTDTKKKGKKVSKKNGYHLVIRQLSTGDQDTLMFVKDFTLAEKAGVVLYHTTGRDSTEMEGVYLRNFNSENSIALTRFEGAYKQLSLDMTGSQAAFLAELDTTKNPYPAYQLRYWKSGLDSAMLTATAETKGIPSGWVVSEHGSLNFSEDASKLYFGTAPKPYEEDTTLLSEEKVQVEIWRYNDDRLMTMQNVQKRRDEQKNYQAVFHTKSGKIVQIATEQIDNIRYGDKRNPNYALGIESEKYEREVTWLGNSKNDLYLINLMDGSRKLINEAFYGFGSLSFDASYITWFDSKEQAYFVYDIEKSKKSELSSGINTSLTDELNDRPADPYPYGNAGWTEDEKSLILYDRYDLWKIDPSGKKAPERITKGRETKTVYRYQNIDYEEPAIPRNMLLRTFNEETKEAGFATLNLKNNKIEQLIEGDYRYSLLEKAKESDEVLYTKQSFELFPDIIASTLDFKSSQTISEANPQKKNFKWGTVEIYDWTSINGEKLQGLVYKPEDFDPKKKYPMMTYFYERNSDNLHRHHGVNVYSSIINPTFYASRGYVVFIPDIPYQIGYPGKSSYDAVIPGITKLLDEGYVDRDRVGVQGQSWGGYQIAYLITQTDIFAAAGAGAPVVNMISAYGGIRWGSGMSRMFQYEQTQSRIGGTLWEYPMRYIENSPIFFMDEVKTPVLIMHNDNDGAVPWYQGIEMYMALRRLNKPAWMVNYNGEGHNPRQYQNKRDYNVRMQQFFDHFLKDAPMPVWMGEGVPAILKGLEPGLELMGDDNK